MFNEKVDLRVETVQTNPFHTPSHLVFWQGLYFI